VRSVSFEDLAHCLSAMDGERLTFPVLLVSLASSPPEDCSELIGSLFSTCASDESLAGAVAATEVSSEGCGHPRVVGSVDAGLVQRVHWSGPSWKCDERLVGSHCLPVVQVLNPCGVQACCEEFSLDWRGEASPTALVAEEALHAQLFENCPMWYWIQASLQRGLSVRAVECAPMAVGGLSGEHLLAVPRGRGSPPLSATPGGGAVHFRTFARVGVMGNPSDGFFGKTVSLAIANYWASASVWEDVEHPGRVTIEAHPVFDPGVFDDLSQLSRVTQREGYDGGRRLVQACLHRLYGRIRDSGVGELLGERFRRGFHVKWHTTIPRQVGLAGSSAILTAVTKAMLRFWGVEEHPELLERAGLGMNTGPSFVLAVETEELGINAGLQDRVVQWWGGLVAMDFERSLMEERGYGLYERLPMTHLPPLFLAYCPDVKDSGKVHAPVKQRWLAGDAEVVEGMKTVAGCAGRARGVLEGGVLAETGHPLCVSARRVGELMRENFAARRRMFGDAALGKTNLRMVEIAHRAGTVAKFPGSGGAVVGVIDIVGMVKAGCLPPSCLSRLEEEEGPTYEQVVQFACDVLRRRFNSEGFVCVMVQPADSSE
jgi:hypothetical protein